MRKKLLLEEHPTRAKRREIKKRPRMHLHGAALRRSSHSAGLIIKSTKPA
ncbi:MAG TPA: hypothetical protein VJK50_00250 [Patescibacteria group bacterium]|nr:hypothetical protein [Patescibacteria group bacterium]